MRIVLPVILIMLAFGSVSWCIYRDMQIEKEYPGDLRNRIVGARLQKDGQPPYFYKWKQNDLIRYYDPQNFDSLKVSNITATPFFHQLLYPIADKPQRTISRIWLGIEYFLFFGMILMGALLAGDGYQKMGVILLGILFLYTNAWTGHIAAGQSYLFIPFFALLFYCFLISEKKPLGGLFAGIFAAILILIRLNTCLFLFPFIFLSSKYATKFKTSFIISFLLCLILAVSTPQKMAYWQDYRKALVEQLKSHQQLHPALQQNDANPKFADWEGWNLQEIAKDWQAFPYNYNQEHGNIFVLVNYALHTKISYWLLLVSGVALLLISWWMFYQKYSETKSFNLYYIATLAFCLYMMTDIFSPIHRFQYNAVQWLFPLLLAAGNFNSKYKWTYIAIFAGLLLNSLNLSFMSMEQTMGEYLVFVALMTLILFHEPRSRA